MRSPIQFIAWIMGIVFTIGFADSFVQLTYKMGQAAVGAHKQDQISYSSYTKLLVKSKNLSTNKSKR